MPDPTLLLDSPPDEALTLRLEGGTGSFRFDRAEYDDGTDRLRLESGPPTAASAELTAEGHVLRIGAPDGHLCGIVLTGVHAHLARHGHVRVTLGPGQHVVLRAADIAHLLTARIPRTGRFRRTS